MAVQATKQKLTKELVDQNLANLNAQAGNVQANAMLEAGKAIGRVEGQKALLEQLSTMFDEPEVDKLAAEMETGLKLVKNEPADDGAGAGQGQ